jgi:hypothetical protein
MQALSLSDKLLQASKRLLPAGVVCCDLAIWLLLVPGKVLPAL